MAKITFSDIRSLEALPDNAFEIIIPNMPGAGGLEKTVALNCKGFTIPGISIQRLEVVLQSFRVHNAAGNVVYPDTYIVQFQETSDLAITRAFKAWMNVCGGGESGTVGGNKQAYARDIILRQYNAQGVLAHEVSMVGSFPQLFSDARAQSTVTPGPVEVDITFSVDKITLTGLEDR